MEELTLAGKRQEGKQKLANKVLRTKVEVSAKCRNMPRE